MTSDHYGDAIAAGAAALAKPYRDPDTISAFVETFPTIAAARVIDAALPHLRDAIVADAIPPGPCGAIQKVPPPSSNGPQSLYALCDLRAGHTGQHEAYDDDWGTYRWTRTDTQPDIKPDGQCDNRAQLAPGDLRVCERTAGHVGYHIDGHAVWDDRGDWISRD